MDKIFAEGLYFDPPRPKAPSYIKGHISVKIKEFIAFLETHKDGDYMRFDVKESRGGKTYIELNTWKANAQSPQTPPNAPESTKDIPMGVDVEPPF